MKTRQLQETPIQDMGWRCQVPGHEKTHLVDARGKRTFPPLNKTADGPLKFIFTYGTCYIPDPEIATDAELRAAGFGSKEAAKAVLDYAMNKENGYYGIKYEIDPNDEDGYWKQVGWLVPNPQIVKEFIGKEKAEKMKKAMTEQQAALKSQAGLSADETSSEKLAEVISPPRRGRPPGRPGVTRGAKGVND